MSTLRYDPLVDANHILGKTFVDQMNGLDPKWAVINIGKDRYSKNRLVREIGTGNFQAARRLQRAAIDLKLKSIDDFYDIPPNSLAALPDFGITTLYVLICFFAKKNKSIKAWYDKNDPGFSQLKRIQADDSTKSEHESARAKKRSRLKTVGTRILKGREGKGTRAVRASLAS